MTDLNKYLSGDELYGDSFDEKRIADWYADEREGYASLGAKNRASYRYQYHAWNREHVFRHLPREASYHDILGFGSAYGDKLLPILPRAKQ